MNAIKHTILFVEDEPDIMNIYTKALQMGIADLEIEPLNRGKLVMEKIQKIQEGKEKKPHLVFLDLILPDINGFEILYALRNHDATKDIPVFILSNYTSEALKNIITLKPDKIFLKAETSPRQLVHAAIQQLKVKRKGISGKK